MKSCTIALIVICLLNLSCEESLREKSFREQLDEARANLKNQSFSVSTYDVDSANYWRVFTQISRIQKEKIRSLTIKSEFRQKDTIVKEVSNVIDQFADYYGQTITTDLSDKITLYYLLKDEQNASMIFRINCSKKGESKIEKLDSLKSKGWTEIKASILGKE